MNVPGVCTLTGEPMGGWVQYSMSPTVSAWLGQHFYLHWKYSADRIFPGGGNDCYNVGRSGICGGTRWVRRVRECSGGVQLRDPL